jgi:protein-S-isoprenylcysteine O-methyltransferase Ste14
MCAAYSVVVYAGFLCTFLYAIGFVGEIGVPKGINDGAVGPAAVAVAINALLLGLFVVQHTIMARPAFKAWFTRCIPEPAERSTFVMITCGILVALFWQWRPLPGVVWSVDEAMGQWLLYGLAAFGWGIVLYSTCLIDHFDLFGVRQGILALRGQPYTEPAFAMPWLYRQVRNPLMLGFMIAFWSTPLMTWGHLMFAMMTTCYAVFGIQLEERDLSQRLGGPYAKYRRSTPMLFPSMRRVITSSCALTDDRIVATAHESMS